MTLLTPGRIGWMLAAALAAPGLCGAQTSPPDLRTLTLEDLMKVPVTTLTRLPLARLRAPANVFVITQDDIRRSGVTSLPEALRLAPGVHVTQIDGNKWAIGIRGFADRLARAMLVLVDGRAVYSPLFAGTYWEVQNLPLDDIERIEVVRGPGGALWGANAVTGIVNIIRKSAAASQGPVVNLRAGTEDPIAMSLRYGGTRGPQFQYRVSGRVAARSPQVNPRGLNHDDQTMVQGGARGDWQTARGAMTLQGDLYRTVIGQRDTLTTYVPPSTQALVSDDVLSGGNVLFRWNAASSNPRAARLQVFYDRTARSELVFKERQQIADVDFQQGTSLGRHGLLWGGAYRVVDGSTTTAGTLRFDPADRVDHLFSGFLQDEVAIVPDRWILTAGAKIEHNAYSGVEWQPSARLLWTPSPAHAVSMSVTRAVRTPSRVEHDFESGSLISPSGPTFVRLLPNPAFEPEELIAYEAGVVTMPHPKLLATVTVFRNQHDRTLSAELGDTFLEADPAGNRLIVPVTLGNGLRGHSYGLEATADVRVAPWWRSTVNYSGLRMNLSRIPGSTDITQEDRAERGSPRHQVQMTTTISLPRGVSVDWFFRYVSALPDVNVRAYGTSNLRLEWAVRERTSLFIAGRNLHQASHAEFSDGGNGVFGIQRAVLVGVRWSR